MKSSECRVKSIPGQTKVLRDHFPELGDPDYDVALEDLPQHAEEWLARPRWEKLAPTYGDALERIYTAIRRKRDFFDDCVWGLDVTHLRQREETLPFWEKIYREQEGDIVILPVQWGMRYAGVSPFKAIARFDANEFGLGAFDVAILLLTHPDRLLQDDDLGINCPGDEYAGEDGQFTDVPHFYFDQKRYWLRSGFGSAHEAHKYYGSASAFLLPEGKARK